MTPYRIVLFPSSFQAHLLFFIRLSCLFPIIFTILTQYIFLFFNFFTNHRLAKDLIGKSCGFCLFFVTSNLFKGSRLNLAATFKFISIITLLNLCSEAKLSFGNFTGEWWQGNTEIETTAVLRSILFSTAILASNMTFQDAVCSLDIIIGLFTGSHDGRYIRSDGYPVWFGMRCIDKLIGEGF